MKARIQRHNIDLQPEILLYSGLYRLTKGEGFSASYAKKAIPLRQLTHL